MVDVVAPAESVSDVLLWIDGDSCPRNLRAILLRAIVRTGIRATFVADRPLPDVVQAMADHTAALRRQVKTLFSASGVSEVSDVLHGVNGSGARTLLNISDIPQDADVPDGFSASCSVDDSSSPIPISEMTVRASAGHAGGDSANVPVAETIVRSPSVPISPINNIRAVRTPIAMVVVNTGTDSADDYIVEHAVARTLAVTHDVPLAARLVEKELVVLDDRGGCFTTENMGERLSLRNAMTEFREMGIYAERSRGIGGVETKAFADALDRQLVELLRRFPDGQVALHPERMLAR